MQSRIPMFANASDTASQVMNNLADCGAAAAFLLVVLAIAVAAEQYFPAFVGRSADQDRVWTNVGLGCMAFALESGLPMATAGVVVSATHWFGGLFPALGAPSPVRILGTLAGMSLAQYVFHRLAHAYEPLWRVHRVHHADTALDITTAFRHHPLEVALTTVWYSAVAVAIGASAAAIAVYGVVGLALAIAQHADIALGARAEAVLSRILVTPGLHHIHHSASIAETDSNFGDVVPWWDRLFGTLTVRSCEQRRSMRIGLGDEFDADSTCLRAQLALPFVTKVANFDPDTAIVLPRQASTTT